MKKIFFSAMLLGVSGLCYANDFFGGVDLPANPIGSGGRTPAGEFFPYPDFDVGNPYVGIGTGGRLPIIYPIGDLPPPPMPKPPEPGKP